jgi:hypothetical protein
MSTGKRYKAFAPYTYTYPEKTAVEAEAETADATGGPESAKKEGDDNMRSTESRAVKYGNTNDKDNDDNDDDDDDEAYDSFDSPSNSHSNRYGMKPSDLLSKAKAAQKSGSKAVANAQNAHKKKPPSSSSSSSSKSAHLMTKTNALTSKDKRADAKMGASNMIFNDYKRRGRLPPADERGSPPKNRREINLTISTEFWLPFGNYYSDIDGSVIKVGHPSHSSASSAFKATAPHSTDAVDASAAVNNEGISEGKLLGSPSDAFTSADYPVPIPTIHCHYSEPLVVKSHTRTIRRSIRLFQRLYIKYKKDFMVSKVKIFIFIRMRFKAIVTRVRHIISCLTLTL